MEPAADTKLTDLYADVMGEITSYLPTKDVKNLLLTSKAMFEATKTARLSGDPERWKALTARAKSVATTVEHMERQFADLFRKRVPSKLASIAHHRRTGNAGGAAASLSKLNNAFKGYEAHLEKASQGIEECKKLLLQVDVHKAPDAESAEHFEEAKKLILAAEKRLTAVNANYREHKSAVLHDLA